MYFSVADQHQNLTPKCNVGSLELTSPTSAQGRSHYSRQICVQLGISPRMEIPSLGNLVPGNFISLYIVRIFCTLIIHIFAIVRLGSHTTSRWDGIALCHVTPAENPVCLPFVHCSKLALIIFYLL